MDNLNLRLIGLLLTAAPLACGQAESNSVTITASRSLSVAPDQVLFSLSATTPVTADLNDVLAALAPLGVTAANLQSAYTLPTNGVSSRGIAPPPMVTWTFALPVPFTNVATTITALTAFQQKQSALQLSFNISGTQASAQAVAGQACPLSDLWSDAKAQAQTIAATAGLTVGPVLALSNQPRTQPAAYTAVVTGYISTTTGELAEVLSALIPQTVTLPCTIVVRFGLFPPIH